MFKVVLFEFNGQALAYRFSIGRHVIRICDKWYVWLDWTKRNWHELAFLFSACGQETVA